MTEMNSHIQNISFEILMFSFQYNVNLSELSFQLLPSLLLQSVPLAFTI